MQLAIPQRDSGVDLVNTFENTAVANVGRRSKRDGAPNESLGHFKETMVFCNSDSALIVRVLHVTRRARDSRTLETGRILAEMRKNGAFCVLCVDSVHPLCPLILAAGSNAVSWSEAQPEDF